MCRNYICVQGILGQSTIEDVCSYWTGGVYSQMTWPYCAELASTGFLLTWSSSALASVLILPKTNGPPAWSTIGGCREALGSDRQLSFFKTQDRYGLNGSNDQVLKSAPEAVYPEHSLL
ncbi:hypothetical protein H671_5g14523 [Cricetulus griseus]|nr:hypothetical protein H671_5g14523 [Cricetulus griseus]